MLWVALVLVVAMAVGAARGGKLGSLTEIRVRAWLLLVLALAVQTAAGFVPLERRNLAVVLVLASFLPLLAFVWLNRSAAGMWIAAIGVLMNFSVIAINGGMPVLPEAVVLAGGNPDLVLGPKHVILDITTSLPFLGDIIPLPGSVVSLGDVFLVIGIGVFIEDQMRRPRRLFARGVQATPGSAADR